MRSNACGARSSRPCGTSPALARSLPSGTASWRCWSREREPDIGRGRPQCGGEGGAGRGRTRPRSASPTRRTRSSCVLWRRRFGTGDYKASGLVRSLDRKVAHLIGYEDARVNYAILMALPERLREHAERLEQQMTVAPAVEQHPEIVALLT